MKKIISIILMLTILLSGISVFASVDNEVEVYVNGYPIVTDQPALIAFGRTLVPLRAICEALNCQVEWIADEQIAEIKNECTIISVKVNNNILKRLDVEREWYQEEILLDVAPIIYNNRVMVPARAIAEALYAKVEWDAIQNRVNIIREFDYISPYFDENGLTEAKKDDKWGFINEAREIVVPLIYDAVGGFSEGLAKIEKNGKCGYINTKGEEVISCMYDDAGYFSEGLAWFVKNEKYGYINTDGEEIIPCIYDSAWNFVDGSALVLKDGEEFHIDKNGYRVDW